MFLKSDIYQIVTQSDMQQTWGTEVCYSMSEKQDGLRYLA